MFYPPRWPLRRELEFYARHFNTVELNNPFYRLPTREAFTAWAQKSPPDFLFAVKASRYITHILRLRRAAAAVRTFLARAEGLGPKLGPMLFQFPARWGMHLDRLQAFLPLLPPGHAYAFEFRHPEWFQEAVYAALRRHHAALCWAVRPDLPLPPAVVTADFIYLRLHAGRGQEGNFTAHELRHWAEILRQRQAAGQRVFAYFNNDWRGLAVRNATSLERILVHAGGEKLRRTA